MDSAKVLDLVEQLDDEIDDLEEALAPLIKTALSETASKLPLLDKAKLYVLATYAIESMLFSYLRLNGVKAREHPVFIELTRVKQYFNKVKVAETPVVKRDNSSLDKGAASRIIKAGLSGNAKYDLQRAEREAKERARAHIKFEEISESSKMSKPIKEAVQANSTTPSSSDSSDSDTSLEAADTVDVTSKVSQKKKKRKVQDVSGVTDPVATTASEASKDDPESARKKKKTARGGRRARKGKKAIEK
ncbi:exosome-associated family protein (Sas10/Utp3/C1D family protein) [Phlyctema vagabunda]|uniref:Exosome complex protein n=1 Tax=Phlyctema vagabunda TaxID=108571 RepID=A0ABR4PA74_9HELO